MACQVNGMGAAWARHAMCESAFGVCLVRQTFQNINFLLNEPVRIKVNVRARLSLTTP